MQEAEFAAERDGYSATNINAKSAPVTSISSPKLSADGKSSTTALDGSTEAEQSGERKIDNRQGNRCARFFGLTDSRLAARCAKPHASFFRLPNASTPSPGVRRERFLARDLGRQFR